MYKALIRSKIRRDIVRLNAGDHAPMRSAVAPDAVLRFPGDNSISRQFGREPGGVDGAPTHIGAVELEAFAQRFVELRLSVDVEDILVNGPPWRTRIWVRGTDRAVDGAGSEVYANRIVACIDAQWGVIRRWEDYLDTVRVQEWDERRAAGDEPAGTDERPVHPASIPQEAR